MVVGFITTYAISASIIIDVVSSNPTQAGCTRHYIMWKICPLLAVGRWFSPGTLVSSTNKTDHYDITEILLKVALNTITHPLKLECGTSMKEVMSKCHNDKFKYQ